MILSSEGLGRDTCPIFFIISKSHKMTVLDIVYDRYKYNSIAEFRDDYIEDLEKSEWDIDPGVYKGTFCVEYYQSWSTFGYEYDSAACVEDEKKIATLDELLNIFVDRQAEEDYYRKCLNMRETYE